MRATVRMHEPELRVEGLDNGGNAAARLVEPLIAALHRGRALALGDPDEHGEINGLGGAQKASLP